MSKGAKRAAGGGAGQRPLLDVSEPAPTFEVMRAPDRPALVVSLGLGRDSVAMLVLLYLSGVRPDLILFADTRGEKPETMRFLHVINAWLRRVGFPEVTVLRHENGKGDDGLEYQLLRLGRVASVAFRNASCSDTWKQTPQKQFVQTWPPAHQTWARNRRVVFAIGFEAGECGRVSRANTYNAAHPSAQFVNWFPLVEAGWNLEKCVAEIGAWGLPTPLKSSCFFCPSSKRHEIEWLEAEHPGMFVRALVMEARAIPELTAIKGLGGRQFRWRDLDCAAPYLAAVDGIAAGMPPPERDRQKATSAALRAAIERVLAIDDDEARALAAGVAAAQMPLAA